ncbi:MBL fold metallo-hydrolase, partial [Erwinia amylovora]
RALGPGVVLMCTTVRRQGWHEVDRRQWLALLDDAESNPIYLCLISASNDGG